MNFRPRSALVGPIGLLLAVVMLWCAPVYGQSASSSSFSLEHQTLNLSGGMSESPSFSMTSCLTQEIAGSASSTSFKVEVGCVASTLTGGLVGDDDDGDGVSNEEEDAAPNNGDANADGTADRLQGHVASLAGTAGYATVAVDPSGGCNQLLVLNLLGGDTFGADPGFSYPLGFVSFTVQCASSGASAPTEVVFHQDSIWPPAAYRNFGPQAPAFGGPVGFYDMPGAIFDTVVIPGEGARPRTSFTLIDGQLGDHQSAGATIVTVGGPALASAAINAIPTMGTAGAGIFVLLIGLVAVWLLARVRMGGV